MADLETNLEMGQKLYYSSDDEDSGSSVSLPCAQKVESQDTRCEHSEAFRKVIICLNKSCKRMMIDTDRESQSKCHDEFLSIFQCDFCNQTIIVKNNNEIQLS